MIFEQYHSQDPPAPSIKDGGVHKLNSSLTSLDFYLLDDIEAYLPPPVQSKPDKHDTINDIINDHSQHQEDLFADLDFTDFDFSDFDEKSDFVDSITTDDPDIEQWISQWSFPSPPMDSIASPLSTVEETLSTTSDSPDMIVPLSPPLSSAGSSPVPTTKKTKLCTVERKRRKKDQNKTAAEKYRTKKKSERHSLLDRHAQLKSINRELKLELDNLAFRVEKFKQLFVDLLQIDPSTVN